MANCYPIQVTGSGTCPWNLQILRRVVLVPLKDDNGDINKITNVAGLTKAALQAKFDASTAYDRYYSTPLLENVEQPRAETTFFEYNSGNKARIKQGTRTFTGWWPDSDPQFLGRMQSWYGQDFGFYGIDKWGNFVYSKNLQDSSDDALYPIPVDGSSWDVNMVTASDAEPFYNMVQFDYKQDFNDAAIRYVAIDKLDFDGRTSDFYGLLPLVPTISSPSAGTSTTINVETDYEIGVSGLTASDFDAYNITDDASISISNAVENPNVEGEYTITSDSIASSDVVRWNVTKTKYQEGIVTVTYS